MKSNTNAPYGKEKNMNFYKKLSSEAKANYDFIEKRSLILKSLRH